MKRIINRFIFGLFVLSLSTVTLTAVAVDRGSKEGAQAIVEAAIAFHKANGKAKMIAEGNRPKNQFRVGVMYIFAYDNKGVSLIHLNPKAVGKNLLEMTDADRFYIIKEIIKIGDSKEGRGWLNYKWLNSASGKVEPKSSYVQKYEDVYYGCGYYL